MTDPRTMALAHEERLRLQGLESFRQLLLAATAKTADTGAALELRRLAEKVNVAIASSEAVRRHLESAVEVRGPSFEMIDRLTELLGELEAARGWTHDVKDFIEFGRHKVMQFRAQVDYTRALGK